MHYSILCTSVFLRNLSIYLLNGNGFCIFLTGMDCHRCSKYLIEINLDILGCYRYFLLFNLLSNEVFVHFDLIGLINTCNEIIYMTIIS